MKYFRLFFLSCIFSSRCLGADITIESYREDLRFVLPDKVKKRKKIEHSDFTHLYQSLWDTIDYIQEKTDKIPFFLPRYFQAVAKDLGKKREFEKTRCGKDIEGDAVDNLILLTCFMEAKSFLEKNELMPKELGQKMAKASKDINAFVLKNTMAKNKKKDCDSCKGERELIDFSQVNFSKYSGGDEEIDKMAKEVVMALYQHQPDSLFSPESFQKLLSCLKEIKSSGEQQVICPSGLKKRKYLQDIPVQFDKTPEFVAIYKENGFNHILNFKPREVYPFSPTRSFSLHSTVITPRNKSVLEREIYLLQKISQMPLAQKRNIQQIVRKPHVESGRLSYIGEPFAVRSSYEKDLLSSKEIKHFVHGCFEGLYNLMSLGIYYTNFLVEEDRVIGITKEKIAF